jgi:RimJ/RimL family protein N-acetyltransferase
MLSGERVVLRPLQAEDLDRLAELSEDLEVSHRVDDSPPLPWSKARWEAELEEWTAEPDDTKARFAIDVDGELVGQCDLWGIDHYRGLCNLGIWLGRAYWGQGFGQDAVRTLVGYANMPGSTATTPTIWLWPSSATSGRRTRARGRTGRAYGAETEIGTPDC